MRNNTNQLWYPNGTIGHTDEKGQVVLPEPMSKDKIDKLVRDATPSTTETDRFSDGVDSDVLSPTPKGSAEPLLKESNRLSDDRSNIVMSPCQKGRAVPLLKDSESDRLTNRTHNVTMKGRAGPLAVKSHRSTVEKWTPCQSSSSPEDKSEPLIMKSDRLSAEKHRGSRSSSQNGAAEPLPKESDRLSDEKHSVFGCPCDMSPCPLEGAEQLITESSRSSDEKHISVRSPCQRSPSPEDRAATLTIDLDRTPDRQFDVVMPPSPTASAGRSIMVSDHSSDKHVVVVMPPTPEPSEYASSPHTHSKTSPGFSDSSSDSDVAEAMQPTMSEPPYLRPEALRSASTISLYSLQGDADRFNGSDRSPSLKSVNRPPTPDSEPHPPTPDKPEEVVVAALSDTISPISPKHPPLADDIPLVELKKDAPFVDFDTHLQHRKQRLRDARAVFAMPGGDGSSDGGGSLGSGEARRGFSYLDNGTGNLPAKPSCRLC